MRAVRLAVAALLSLALAVLPVSASLAALPAAQAEMCASAHEADCPCCDTTQARGARICNLKCCGAVAILSEPPLQRRLPAQAGTDVVEAALSPFSAQPDTPPPRA